MKISGLGHSDFLWWLTSTFLTSWANTVSSRRLAFDTFLWWALHRIQGNWKQMWVEKGTLSEGDVSCDGGFYMWTKCPKSPEDAVTCSDSVQLYEQGCGFGEGFTRSVIPGPILISKRVESKWGDGLKQRSPDINCRSLDLAPRVSD